jgi:hypothetical protein
MWLMARSSAVSQNRGAGGGDCALSKFIAGCVQKQVCTKTGASKCLSVFFSCLLVDDDKAVRWIGYQQMLKIQAADF